MGINRNKIFSLLLVLLGNIAYTFTVKLFLLPANLISCGTTGIALVVNRRHGRKGCSHAGAVSCP